MGFIQSGDARAHFKLPDHVGHAFRTPTKRRSTAVTPFGGSDSAPNISPTDIPPDPFVVADDPIAITRALKRRISELEGELKTHSKRFKCFVAQTHRVNATAQKHLDAAEAANKLLEKEIKHTRKEIAAIRKTNEFHILDGMSRVGHSMCVSLLI
jgi:hypothetical protein